MAHSRTTFDADATWTRLMPFAVTVGYAHNGNGYDARIFESSGENVFRVSADAVGTSWLTFRTVGQDKKGVTAILDANIVTILVAFILFALATSGVRGFALTLGVGVIVSLFTAVLATQAILYALRGTRLLRSRAALGARDSKPIRFDFIGGSRWFFSMSGLILLVCALAIAIQGLNFGIDFEGGTRITAPLERPATVDQVRDTLAPLGLAEAEIQTVDNPELGRNVVQINAEELQQNEVDRVEDTLRDRFGFADDPARNRSAPASARPWPGTRSGPSSPR